MSEHSASQARENLSDLINQAAYAKERVVLTRRGKKLAAIVPIEDLDRLEALEEAEDVQEAQEALARIAAGEEAVIPWEKALQELGWES